MNQVKSILVVIDPTTIDQPALKRAAAIARVTGADVELFMCVYQSSIVSNWFLDEQALDWAKTKYLEKERKWLKEFCAKDFDEDINVKFDVTWQTPLYQGIIDKSLRSNVDLIIKSTHRHSEVNKIFMTPTDWQLIKTSSIPVLLAKSGHKGPYKNVMAAVDPSLAHGKSRNLDNKILESTSWLSDRFKAQLKASYCYEAIDAEFWQDPTFSSGMISTNYGDWEQYLEQLKKSHQGPLDSLLSKFDIDTEQVLFEQGNPINLLPEQVRKHHIDVLVMGTRYRSGLLGSTVEKVLDEVDCDILTVKDNS